MPSDQPYLWSDDLAERLARAEAEVARLRAELAHSQRLATIGTIAGSIAHEFNNLLTPVLSYAELALARPGDDSLATKALERAASGADRASRIAGAILGFIEPCARSARGPANVLDCVRQSFLCLAQDPSKDSIHVDVCVPSNLQAAIDPVALQHVLLNLILNARRALKAVPILEASTGPGPERDSAGGGGGGGGNERAGDPDRIGSLPAGAPIETATALLASRRMRIEAFAPGIRPECSTWNISKPTAGFLAIAVTDTGCGMSEAMLARTCRPFERESDHKGSGLGLSIVRQLVGSAGGSLDVRSRQGVGTCVTLTLPVAQAAESAAAA